MKTEFVRCVFERGGPTSKKPKEYTYRIDPGTEVKEGQYALTRRNLSKVTVVAVDCPPVPGLDLSKYDFIDPLPMLEEASPE